MPLFTMEGDWVYTSFGGKAHWRAKDLGYVQCRAGIRAVTKKTRWLGTDYAQQQEKAASLPKCSECIRFGAPND